MGLRLILIPALIAASLAAGCGDDDSDGDREPAARTGTDAASAETTASGELPAGLPALRRPILPRCREKGFRKAAVTPMPPEPEDGFGAGWRVIYQFNQGFVAPKDPDATTSITFLETAPATPRGQAQGEGVREALIAGRKVSLSGTGGRQAYIAIWKTRKARYLALANGNKRGILDRFIACMP
jgi:hypothetical protein